MKYFLNLLFVLSLAACAVGDISNQLIEKETGELTLPGGQVIKWPFSDFDCEQCTITKNQLYLPQGIENELLALSQNNETVFVITSKRSKKNVRNIAFKIINKNKLNVCYHENCQLIKPMKSFEFNDCLFIVSNVHYQIMHLDNIKDGNQIEFTVNGICSN